MENIFWRSLLVWHESNMFWFVITRKENKKEGKNRDVKKKLVRYCIENFAPDMMQLPIPGHITELKIQNSFVGLFYIVRILKLLSEKAGFVL